MPITQARRSNRRLNTSKKQPIKHGLREIVLIFFCFVGLYLLVSLMTYYGSDPGISHSGPVEEVQNKGGVAGALFADLFLYLFGYFAYFFPFMVGYVGWLIYQGRHHDILAEPKSLIIPGIGFVLTLSAGCGLAIVHFSAESVLLPTHAGGILGQWIGHGLVSIVSPLGATLILLALFFTGVTLLTGLSWLKLMDTLGYHTLLRWPTVKQITSQQFIPWFLVQTKKGLQLVQHYLVIFLHQMKRGSRTAYTRWQTRRAEWQREREEEEEYYISDAFDDDNERYSRDDDPYERKPNEFQQSQIKKGRLSPLQPPSQYKTDSGLTDPLLPALNLLESKHHFITSPKVKRLSQRMVDAFATLKVEVIVHVVQPGPVLNCYEVEPITPINTNHLDELSEALTKALKVEMVQIEENQPGILDIDIPNLKRQPIYLKELLSGNDYQDNLSPLAVALGQDVAGQPVIVDLTRIPHILMAGCDSSENTLAINTLFLSLLYKSTPESLRFILIDSSTQELSTYLDLPHLLIPVITAMEQAVPALQWCVQEMERRYRLMASLGVRNIENYNQTQQLQTDKSPDDLPEEQETLFYVVVIINELAELIDSMGTEVEPLLTRLTQKARAAGIHIILATQHPTVNVITGLIKSNIPTRMAFQVTNPSESRAILGQPGAETLLGQGDMLYMTAGTGMPVRVHGSFVSEKEVQKVITDLKARATPNYINLESE